MTAKPVRNWPDFVKVLLTVIAAICAVAVIGSVSAAGRDQLAAGFGVDSSATEVASEDARPESPAASSPSSEPSASQSLAEAEAVAAARAAVPQTQDRDIRVAKSGPLSEVWEDSLAMDWAQALPADQPVWYLYFAKDDLGSVVILDMASGRVYFHTDLILNGQPTP